MSRILSFGLILASILPALAQVSSSCNPIAANQTTPCPPDPALGGSYTWNMTNNTLGPSSVWDPIDGALGYSNNAAQFVIAEKGQSPLIKSNFYFWWGGASVSMMAAKGQGIVTSLTFLSDDLDEIDFELIGGNNSYVQTNYFGKGNTTVYDRAVWVPVNDPQGTFHNYSINWSSSELQWLIDGVVVRSLPQAQADGHGSQFPQTPMVVRMALWAGGDASLGNSPGTVQWAGGPVDYSQLPFTMQVASVTVNDGTRGVSQYTYGDKTGDWQSIKTVAGNSSIFTTLNTPPSPGIIQEINNLSTTAKIGIAVGIGGGLFLLAALCTFCCLRQRKAGRRDRRAADADWDRANSEMLAYRQEVNSPGHNPNPFSDSKTYLPAEGDRFVPQSYPHESYQMGPPSPNPQYAPQQFRF